MLSCVTQLLLVLDSTSDRLGRGEAEADTVALRALDAALLLHWEDIYRRHPEKDGEAAAQKAARRDELLLQLLLRMHILRLAAVSNAG
jgi:hypothetical protein